MSNNEFPSLDYNSHAIPVTNDDPSTEAYSEDHPGDWDFNYYPVNQGVWPSPTIKSRLLEDFSLFSQASDYESNSVAGRSESSRGSKDSGYESAHRFHCSYEHCKYVAIRQDNLVQHQYRVHAKHIPKQDGRSERGLEWLGEVGSYNADSKAPSELEAQVEINNEVPTPPIEPPKYSTRILKPVGLPNSTTDKLPKTTMLLGSTSNLESLQSLSSQAPYVAEKSPGTASGVKKAISHDMGEDHMEPPGSTSLKSVRDAQVAPEPEIIHGESISQSVNAGHVYNGLNPDKTERRPLTVSAVMSPRAFAPTAASSTAAPTSRPALHSRSVTSPANNLAKASKSVNELLSDNEGDETFSEDERSTGYSGAGQRLLGSTSLRNAQTSIRKMAPGLEGKDYRQRGLLRKQSRSQSKAPDVERSTMTITGECGVQDKVEPEKIVLEPDNKARASILDRSVHTMPLTLTDADGGLMNSLPDDGYGHLQDGDDVSLVDDSCSNLNPVEHLANTIAIKDCATTGFSGEPIEPAGDISSHQKLVELYKAVMDADERSIASILMIAERMTSHVHPVKPPEDITMVEDAAQMSTLANLVEAADDPSPHMIHDAHASTKLVQMAPQYDAYTMTLLSLRIELRIWHGRHAPSPTIHISTGGEELLEDGKQRIRWTCCCGRRLYDDFEELRPGAIEELEQMLNEQNRVCSPESNGSAQQSSSSIRALWTAAGGIIASLTGSRPLRNNNLPTLPLHQHHAAGQEQNPPSSATSETLFLLMCIPYRKHGTRLVHMDLAKLVSDETLFRKLRREYQSIRGQWASYFSLWKMAELQFVKFGLHKHQLIDIKKKNDLPPVSLKNEYRYQPIPAETIPPIGKNHLMHLYEHPDHADDVPFCLERIPKKVREQLKLSPLQAPGLLGWGVYFAEGFDWPKFWVFGSVTLILSVLFGVCWSTLRQDIQGGFGVTACMMVAVTFTTGVVQAAVEQR